MVPSPNGRLTGFFVDALKGADEQVIGGTYPTDCPKPHMLWSDVVKFKAECCFVNGEKVISVPPLSSATIV